MFVPVDRMLHDDRSFLGVVGVLLRKQLSERSKIGHGFGYLGKLVRDNFDAIDGDGQVHRTFLDRSRFELVLQRTRADGFHGLISEDSPECDASLR